jgi:hypothetical protein
MIRRPIFSLVSLGAILGMLGTAQAGTITYDWVTPSNLTNGSHFTGSISVDSTGISATPIDLTLGTIQSWQISVFDSMNNFQFSLSSSSDFIHLGVSDSNGSTAPEVTTTSIFLPALSLTGPLTINISEFDFETDASGNSVEWLSQIIPSESDINIRVSGALGELDSALIPGNDHFLIATAEVIPEPASLAMWSFAAGVFGVWSIRKRRRRQAAA